MRYIKQFQINRISILLTCQLDNETSKTRIIQQLIETYISELERRCKTNGPVKTIAFLKEVHSISVKLALGVPFKPLPWTKSDKKGFPTFIKGVKPFLVGDSIHKRIGLTITNMYKLITVKPDKNTDSITNPYSGSRVMSNKWGKFLDNYSKSFRTQGLQWDKHWHKTTKIGPNGPALLCSMLDVVALKQDPKVLSNLVNLLALTDRDLLLEFMGLCDQVPAVNKTLCHSKLSFISEGGGKTRVIAIADYFTQEALKPIFKETMHFLSTISEDGTYQQGQALHRVKLAIAEGKPLFSLDLKSATDRFPLFLQKDLLSRIYGSKYTEAWAKVMTDRSFMAGRKGVRYAVGQPMGLLSSWSVFALTHHAFVKYCASRSGYPNFKDYCILGDDIVIFNELVAKKYSNEMKRLGVEISLAKSHIWTPAVKSFPHSEFAKQILWNGYNISPIPIDLMLIWSLNPVKEFFGLRFALRRMDFFLPESPVNNFVKNLPLQKRDRSSLEILYSAPSSLIGEEKSLHPESFVDSYDEGPWENLDVNLVPLVLTQILHENFESKLNSLWLTIRKLEHYSELANSVGKEVGRSIVKSPIRQTLKTIKVSQKQPLVEVIQDLREKIVFVSLKSSGLVMRSGGFLLEKKLWKDIQEISDDYFGIFKTERSKISRVQSSVVLKVYKALKQGVVIPLGESAKPGIMHTMSKLLSKPERE